MHEMHALTEAYSQKATLARREAVRRASDGPRLQKATP